MSGKKFIQVLEPTVFRILRARSRKRGIHVQELIRAVIIPEWLEENRQRQSKRRSSRKSS